MFKHSLLQALKSVLSRPTMSLPPTEAPLSIGLIIRQAHASGATVIIRLRQDFDDSYQGQIISVSDEAFTLFHSGREGGVLWCFQWADVLSCGLLVNQPVAESSSNYLNEGLPAKATHQYPLEDDEGMAPMA